MSNATDHLNAIMLGDARHACLACGGVYAGRDHHKRPAHVPPPQTAETRILVSVCPLCGWIGKVVGGVGGADAALTPAERKQLPQHPMAPQIKAFHDSVVERMVG